HQTRGRRFPGDRDAERLVQPQPDRCAEPQGHPDGEDQRDGGRWCPPPQGTGGGGSARLAAGGAGKPNGHPASLLTPPAGLASATGAERPVPASCPFRTCSWYSSSAFTRHRSCSAPNMFSTANSAVSIEWSWLLYLCMPLR